MLVPSRVILLTLVRQIERISRSQRIVTISKMPGKPIRTVEDWDNQWKEGRLGWHRVEPHVLLEKHFDAMVNGRKNCKIFVPLCGKEVSMKWVGDQGHTVIGVDGAELAFQQFGEEHKVKLIADKTEQRTKYEDEGGKFQFYNCDLYSFPDLPDSKDLKVEGIWDRMSFNAINIQDREKYRKLVLSLMTPETKYFLVAVEYDRNKISGPPHCVTKDNITEWIGDKCDITELGTFDAITDNHKSWGLESFIEHLYILTLKK